MKLNNKGFAISGILYAVMLLFLTLILALLAMISNRKMALDKYKNNIKNELNTSAENYGSYVQIKQDTLYIRLSEEELLTYDLFSNVAGCLNGGHSRNTLCQPTDTDITNLLNYKIYDQDNNEIIKFNYDNISHDDGFTIKKVYYTYYSKDSNGNYIVSNDKKSLKVNSKYLDATKENIFYVRYSVVDNNNQVSKEVTRTLVTIKYNNYINIVKNNFVVNSSEINNYNFKNNANCYILSNDSLVKDNSILMYKIYDSEDKEVTTYENMSTNERYKVRYFTNSVDNSTSEIMFAYFVIE